MASRLGVIASVLRRPSKQLLITALALVICLLPTATAVADKYDTYCLRIDCSVYDPGTCGTDETDTEIGDSGQAGTAEELIRKQSIDPKWVDLIVKYSREQGADPLVMASAFFWENRAFPEYKDSGWAGSPSNGDGPWQFTAGTWPGYSSKPYQPYVEDPVESTKAAAKLVKAYGGGTGAKGGSIDQNFGKGSLIKSVATVVKNYNAGPGTWRQPGKADYMEPGRVWQRAGGAWDGTKNQIIDTYVVGATFVYYQIGSGQKVSWKDDASYVADALQKKDDIKNFVFGGSGGVLVPSEDGQCVVDKCSTEPASSNGNTVVIDPGHGPSKTTTDAQTKLVMAETDNQPEGKDVWEVSQDLKQKLERDGYKVILTKKSQDDDVTFRGRAEIANKANAALAISVHTDGTPTFGAFKEVWPQEVGQYRQQSSSGGKKTVFKNDDVAKKSQEYANIFKEERQKVEGGNVKLGHFARNDVPSPGTISMVQLFAEVPWVYQEVGSGPNSKGLSSAEKTKYTEGLYKGIRKSLGDSPAKATPAATNEVPTADDCAQNGSIEAAVKLAVSYSWADGRGTVTAKENYTKVNSAAKRAGEYIGGGVTDCGAFVTRVMRNSGADPSYNWGPKNAKEGYTVKQQEYLEQSSKYEKLGKVTDVKNLQPGDIAINSGHTYMYVGKQSSDFKGDSAGASLYTKTPHAHSVYFDHNDGPFSWYRLKEE